MVALALVCVGMGSACVDDVEFRLATPRSDAAVPADAPVLADVVTDAATDGEGPTQDARTTTEWVAEPSPTSVSFHGAWGSAPDDLWAVGDIQDNAVLLTIPRYAEIVHWDGQAWRVALQRVEGISLLGVWGRGPNDAWAYGYQLAPTRILLTAAVFHWNGEQWTRQPLNEPVRPRGSVGLADGTDVIVGEDATGGVLLANDGMSWHRQSAPASMPKLVAVNALPSTDLWTLGANGDVWQWSSGAWTRPATRLTANLGEAASLVVDAEGIWVGSVGSGVSRYRAGRWELAADMGAPSRVRGMWWGGPTDLWTVGDNGSIAQWDGTRWTSRSVGGGGRLEAVWGTPAGDVWVFGERGTILRAKR